jgi:ABC-2 type transport system ATP-binding protein
MGRSIHREQVFPWKCRWLEDKLRLQSVLDSLFFMGIEKCMDKFAIYTDNLVQDFGPVKAVDRLNLEIPQGIVFGFLGPNGAGKTTTIRLLLGLLEPSHGTAKVLGFDTRTQADEIRSRTGALLEHTGLYERLSAEDNLDFYARIWHLSSAERQARIKELLTHLG